ncbi:transposase [Tolypothrix tenuis]
MPSNLKWEDIKELRILPRNRCFYAEFVYPVEKEEKGLLAGSKGDSSDGDSTPPEREQLDRSGGIRPMFRSAPRQESGVISPCSFSPCPLPLVEDIKSQLSANKVLGIDHGIDNWLTCVSNIGTSFIVDGKHLKSLNQWYNKRVASLKENKEQGFWSKQLAAITEKRNRQMRDAVNKAARLVISHCLENSIGRIVFGWNQGQKDNANMGRKANQKFVQIPTAKLKERIIQLCQQYGIDFVETEEANTSAASFVDGDSLPKYGEKPEGWKSSGKRVKRGLFRTANNWYINADTNGAANIVSKVAATLGINLSGVSRGALTTPLRVHLWTLKNPPTFCLNKRSEI